MNDNAKKRFGFANVSLCLIILSMALLMFLIFGDDFLRRQTALTEYCVTADIVI